MTVFVQRWPDAVGRVWIKSQLLADFAFPVTVVPSMVFKKRKEKKMDGMVAYATVGWGCTVDQFFCGLIRECNLSDLIGFLMLWFDFWFVVADFSCMNLSFLGQFGQ